jgi:hypothetical protein
MKTGPMGKTRTSPRPFDAITIRWPMFDHVLSSRDWRRRWSEKHELQPDLQKRWVIPPEENADFVAPMEDVLDGYERPYNPKRPGVCRDEQPTPWIEETRIPVPARPGQAKRYDYEYRRNGTANHFMFCQPLGNWRRVGVREHKTARDWAEEMARLLDEDFPKVEKMVLICDNLNAHTAASFYGTFPLEQARKYVKRWEIHHTPKHGRWLNAAEIELGILTKQCLDRRIPNIQIL